MLTQIFGIEVPAPVGVALIFVGLILLFVLCVWLIRSFGGKRIGSAAATGRSRQPRLGVLDVLAIDGRRRLVIVRRDNVEHLVLIGGPNDVVVESGILRVPAGAPAQRDAPSFPADARAAPPQPVPAQTPALRGPQPERIQPPSQPIRTPDAVRQPDALRGPAPRAVEPPPLAPMRDGSPPSTPVAAPAVRPAVPARQAPSVTAPAAVVAGPAEPSPAASGTPQPIAAGPASRAAPPRSSEIADRLAVALKRPVAAIPVATVKAAAAKPAPAVEAPPIPAPTMPPLTDSEADANPAPVGKPASAIVPPSLDGPPNPAKVEAPAAAPNVRAEPRQAPAHESASKVEDDDPLASLEAEMASLLGRDMGQPKP